MPSESNVSTEDTPLKRDDIEVVTEENQAAPKAPDKEAAPPDDDDQAGQIGDDPAPSDTDKQPSDDGEKSKKRRSRPSERRISQLTRKVEGLVSDAKAKDTEIATLTEANAKLKADTPKPKKPRFQDFTGADAADDFGQAYAAWERASAEESPPAKAPPTTAPPADEPPQKRPDQVELDELHKVGKERFGDEFAEIILDTSLPMSLEMLGFIYDSDLGPELVMWADDNRDEAAKLYHMSGNRVERKLAAIEKNLKKQPKARTDPSGRIRTEEGRKVSEAPDPPGEPVSDTNTSSDSLEGLDMDHYADRRRKAESKTRMR